MFKYRLNIEKIPYPSCYVSFHTCLAYYSLMGIKSLLGMKLSSTVLVSRFPLSVLARFHSLHS